MGAETQENETIIWLCDKPHYENIPHGWACCKFDELCTTFSTGPFGSMVHKSDYVSTDGIPLVNPTNIVNGEIRTEKLMKVNCVKAKELDRYKLNLGDILLARRGDLSKCAIISEREENWLCGTGSFVLHVPFVLPRYIEFFYSSEYVQTILSHECVGATMDNLNQSVLGQLSFLLPPLAEQHRIVAAIEHCFALVDLIEKEKNDLQSVIQQTKSKVLDLAIQGKLVPQDPADEPATELLKRINPNAVPCDTSHYGNLPSSWCICTLKNVFDITMGSSPNGSSINAQKNGIEFHQGKICFTDMYLQETDVYTNKPTKLTEPHSLLLCVRAPVGIVNITERKVCIGRGLCALKPKAGIDLKFAFYTLQ